MGMVYFLLILLTVLIVLTLISTIIKLALYITIRYNYDSRLLIIPSILTIYSWVLVGIAWVFCITHYLQIDMIASLTNLFILKQQTLLHMKPLIISSTIFGIIGILLQACTYFTVNIDYIKIKGKIRMFFKKIFPISTKRNVNTAAIILDTRPDNLTFGNALIASLFAFTFIILFIFILLYLGHFLSVLFLK